MLREALFPPKATQHRGNPTPNTLIPTGAETSPSVNTLPPGHSLCSAPVLQVAEAPPEVLDTGALRVYCQLPDCLWLALDPCPELGGLGSGELMNSSNRKGDRYAHQGWLPSRVLLSEGRKTPPCSQLAATNSA